MSSEVNDLLIIKTPESTHNERLVLVFLTLLFILKGVLWSMTFPLWQAPDEDDHYNVIQFIGEYHRLPNISEDKLLNEVRLSRILADVGRVPYFAEQRQAFSKSNIGLNESEFDIIKADRGSLDPNSPGKMMHGTPLYYIIAAIPYQLTKGWNLLERAYFQRILSVLLSAPILLVAYLFLREIYPPQHLMRISPIILLAFHPMISHVTAAVSPDGFGILFFMLCAYFTLKVWLNKQFTWKLALLIVITFSIGLLIKPMIIGLVPLIGLVILGHLWQNKREFQVVGQKILMQLFVFTLIAGWWIIRSLQFNQDPFYYNPILKGYRVVVEPFYDYGFMTQSADFYSSLIGGYFPTWWGHFGWIDTAIAPIYYYILGILSLISIIGLIIKSPNLLRNHILTKRQKTFTYFILLIFIQIILIQISEYMFWQEFGIGRGYQGRHFLMLAFPILTIFLVGISSLVKSKWHHLMHQIIWIGMISLNFISLIIYVLPRYYR